MSGFSPEDAIAMERRHILKGETLIAHQEALLNSLMENGLGHLIPGANDVLKILREAQELSIDRLRDLELRYHDLPRARPE